MLKRFQSGCAYSRRSESVRVTQVEAHLDSKKRLAIARSFIEAKLERSGQILDWLGESEDIEGPTGRFRKEVYALRNAKTVDQIRRIEAHAAVIYWQAFRKVVPSKLEFKSRSTKASSRQYNASDQANALLNYGYAFLQSSVRRAVNMTGLDASLGSVHEDKPATTPLVYDFQEPFRWLVDYTVLRMLLSRSVSWDDFYFTGDDYRLRMKPPLLDRYVHLLREQFNSGVVYGGRRLMWDTVTLRKCQELARYLLGKTDRFDLKTPRPVLERSDTHEIREKILNLSCSQAGRLGLGKSTVHYLKKRARDRKAFTVYKPVLVKLKNGSSLSSVFRVWDGSGVRVMYWPSPYALGQIDGPLHFGLSRLSIGNHPCVCFSLDLCLDGFAST